MCKQFYLNCGHLQLWRCSEGPKQQDVAECAKFSLKVIEFAAGYCQECQNFVKAIHEGIRNIRNMIFRRENMAALAKDDEINAQMAGDMAKFKKCKQLHAINLQEAAHDREVLVKLEECISTHIDILNDNDRRRLSHAAKYALPPDPEFSRLSNSSAERHRSVDNA